MGKRFSTIMVLIAVLLVLTACAPKATPTPAFKPVPTKQQQAASTSVATPAATTASKVKIRMWEQAGEIERSTVLYPLVKEFMAANPNIIVDVTNYDNEELRNQFQTAALAGTAPEIVRGPNDFVGQFSAKDLLLPIREEMLDQAFLDTFLPGMLAGGTAKGTLWGVPDYVGGHLMLLYNKKLVPNPPADTVELIKMAQEATDQTGGNWGLVFNIQEPFWLAPWLGGFGGWMLDKATDMPTLDTPAMAAALQFLRDLIFSYQVIPAGCDYEMARVLFGQGKAAMLIDGDWSLRGYRQTDVDLGIAPLPKVAKTGLWPTPLAEGRYYMVSSHVTPDTPEFAAVKKFIEFMTGEHAQQMWLEKLQRLPSNRNVAQSPLIQQDPILAGAVAQLEKARAMPAALQLRCFWDSVRPQQQAVLAGTLTPEDAARKMQEEAELCIEKARADAEQKP